MKARILVVGSSNTDKIVKAPRLPHPGETTRIFSTGWLRAGKILPASHNSEFQPSD
jgi:hypothetical protein